MTRTLPLLPTTVCGSHALPSWLFLVREMEGTDRLGPADLQEAYDDAVRLAIRDQIEAGVDVISDGEMRRTTFIRGFYQRLAGLEALPAPRRLGPPNYDTHCPYQVVGRVEAPRGLGIVDDFRFARAHADRGNHHALQEHPGQQEPRRRPDRQAHAELARARADGERQHAGDADDGDQQRDASESREHKRIQPLGRQHFRAHLFERRPALDRLLG
jgi:hypothetical protein